MLNPVCSVLGRTAASPAATLLLPDCVRFCHWNPREGSCGFLRKAFPNTPHGTPGSPEPRHSCSGGHMGETLGVPAAPSLFQEGCTRRGDPGSTSSPPIHHPMGGVRCTGDPRSTRSPPVCSRRDVYGGTPGVPAAPPSIRGGDVHRGTLEIPAASHPSQGGDTYRGTREVPAALHPFRRVIHTVGGTLGVPPRPHPFGR